MRYIYSLFYLYKLDYNNKDDKSGVPILGIIVIIVIILLLIVIAILYILKTMKVKIFGKFVESSVQSESTSYTEGYDNLSTTKNQEMHGYIDTNTDIQAKESSLSYNSKRENDSFANSESCFKLSGSCFHFLHDLSVWLLVPNYFDIKEIFN